MLQQNIATQEHSCGPALKKMLVAFPQSTQRANGWWSHPDNPTFDFRENEDGSIYIHSWTGRTRNEILAMGGLQVADTYSRGYKTVHVRDKLDLLELSHARFIPWQFLFNLGLQDGYRYGGYNVVKIPYYNANGTQHTKIKVRKATEGKYKHGWDEGTPGDLMPYGLNKLGMAKDYLLIGEGESDAWACWFHNVPYLGIPGSNTQKCLAHLDITMLPTKVYILQEPDQTKRLLEDGQGFYKSVHNTLRFMGYQGQIFCIDFKKTTSYKDPGELHIALWNNDQAKGFKEVIKQAMDQALPANDTQDKPPVWDIQDERVLQALASQDKQAIYALAPDITEMDATQQDRIRLAVRDVWGKDFPMQEFNGLLRSAKDDNERNRQAGPDFITAEDLMKLHFDPVDFVIPDILPTGLIVLGGKQKIGKSWFDLNICLSVAMGGIALSKYQVKQGDVLYMALEDHRRRLQDRMSQLLGPDAQAPKGLTVVTKWRRMDEGGLEDLEQWITQHPNARLVMIDPWVLVKPKGKTRAGETGYDVEYKALEGIKKLADNYGICILIQFHLRKANAEDPFDELNATTGVTACADGFISLKRARTEEEGTLFASGRDYKEEVNLAVSFKGGRWKVLGEGQSAIYYTLGQERKAIIDLLCSKVDPYGVIQPTTPKDIAVLLNIDSDKVRKLLWKMKNDDQVKWIEEDKEKGIQEGYISLIPSPKVQQPNERVNRVDVVDTEDAVDAVDAVDGDNNQVQNSNNAVTNGTERLQGVSSVDTPIKEPVEPFEDTRDRQDVPSVYDVYASTQNEHNPTLSISLETFWSIGKQRGYPEIPDLDLRSGKIGWNSFVLAHRIRIPDVIARLSHTL
jgi:hypothetical protein